MPLDVLNAGCRELVVHKWLWRDGPVPPGNRSRLDVVRVIAFAEAVIGASKQSSSSPSEGPSGKFQRCGGARLSYQA